MVAERSKPNCVDCAEPSESWEDNEERLGEMFRQAVGCALLRSTRCRHSCQKASPLLSTLT